MPSTAWKEIVAPDEAARHAAASAMFRPSSFAPPKCPRSILKNPTAWQKPCVGSALNWHPQAYEQLQFPNSIPWSSHCVISRSCKTVLRPDAGRLPASY